MVDEGKDERHNFVVDGVNKTAISTYRRNTNGQIEMDDEAGAPLEVLAGH